MILAVEKQNTRRHIRLCATLPTLDPTRVGWPSNTYLHVWRLQPHHPTHDTPPEDISFGVKWPEHAADYSPRSTGNVKN